MGRFPPGLPGLAMPALGTSVALGRFPPLPRPGDWTASDEGELADDGNNLADEWTGPTGDDGPLKPPMLPKLPPAPPAPPSSSSNKRPRERMAIICKGVGGGGGGEGARRGRRESQTMATMRCCINATTRLTASYIEECYLFLS